MTTPTAQEFLAAAASEIGYTETPAGSNRTKFAAEAGHPNGYSWCLTFLDAIAKRTGLVLPAGVSNTAYTPSAAGDFQRAGRWSQTPAVGAWVFYDWPGDGVNRIQHVGVVEAIYANGSLRTIEGNTSFDDKGSQSNGGAVARRTRTTSAVKGYGLPEYAQAPKPAPAPAPAAPAKPKAPAAVIVAADSPEAALLVAYPALFSTLPVRILATGAPAATDNPNDIAFGVAVWGAKTQIRGADRYETLRLALDFVAKR